MIAILQLLENGFRYNLTEVLREARTAGTGLRKILPEANNLPIAKDIADRAMDSAQCIGCGACVAACKNAAAHLFTSAKITHLGLLPQGESERDRRVVRMVEQMDGEGFGSCSNEGECEAVCPKEISISNIARMNRDFLRAIVR